MTDQPNYEVLTATEYRQRLRATTQTSRIAFILNRQRPAAALVPFIFPVPTERVEADTRTLAEAINANGAADHPVRFSVWAMSDVHRRIGDVFREMIRGNLIALQNFANVIGCLLPLPEPITAEQMDEMANRLYRAQKAIASDLAETLAADVPDLGGDE